MKIQSWSTHPSMLMESRVKSCRPQNISGASQQNSVAAFSAAADGDADPPTCCILISTKQPRLMEMQVFFLNKKLQFWPEDGARWKVQQYECVFSFFPSFFFFCSCNSLKTTNIDLMMSCFTSSPGPPHSAADWKILVPLRKGEFICLKILLTLLFKLFLQQWMKKRQDCVSKMPNTDYLVELPLKWIWSVLAFQVELQRKAARRFSEDRITFNTFADIKPFSYLRSLFSATGSAPVHTWDSLVHVHRCQRSSMSGDRGSSEDPIYASIITNAEKLCCVANRKLSSLSCFLLTLWCSRKSQEWLHVNQWASFLRIQLVICCTKIRYLKRIWNCFMGL